MVAIQSATQITKFQKYVMVKSQNHKNGALVISPNPCQYKNDNDNFVNVFLGSPKNSRCRSKRFNEKRHQYVG